MQLTLTEYIATVRDEYERGERFGRYPEIEPLRYVAAGLRNEAADTEAGRMLFAFLIRGEGF